MTGEQETKRIFKGSMRKKRAKKIESIGQGEGEKKKTRVQGIERVRGRDGYWCYLEVSSK